jgi:hypothetical protein
MKLICGWCGLEFEINIFKDKFGERNIVVCPNCNATLPSSRKELTGQVVGRKHIHTDWKAGDKI